MQALQGEDFMSIVQDDTPVAVQGASVSIRVDENFHHGRFHFGFGHFDDTRFTRSELQDLVDAGTDEPALFKLNTSITGPVMTADGTPATSHGVQIKLAVAGQRIIGFADTDADGSRDPGEHVIFRLVDQGIRGFDFDLTGEVDHPASTGTSGAEVLSLDLTHAFSATDSDGDPVTLATNSIVVELGEPNGDQHGPHDHWPHGWSRDHWPHEHGPDGPGQDGPGQVTDESQQHEEGQCQATPDFLSLLTGLAGEASRGIGDVLADTLTGDRRDAPSVSAPQSDVLANLADDAAFFFNDELGAPFVTHLVAAAAKAFDFLDELALNIPPLQAALTELEDKFEMIANALQEHLPKNESSSGLQIDNLLL
jgi:hypothetical protein